MVVALDDADAAIDRQAAIAGSGTQRNKWSNRFADACAAMVADRVRVHSAFAKLHVRPESGGPSEPLTFVAGDREKKVDVVVSSLVSGLQVGFSLKGMNFRGKWAAIRQNLTGRTYELRRSLRDPPLPARSVHGRPVFHADRRRQEVRSIAVIVHVPSSTFERTGRLDPTLTSQIDKVDAAAIALYVPGDSEQLGDFEYEDTLPRGVVRYFDVETDPPRRGRPTIDSTMDLDQLVDLVASRARPGAQEIPWAKPEVD